MNAPLRHPVAVLKERPFDGPLRILPVDWSAERTPSIAEILGAQSDLPPGFRERCVARVNGELVPRAMWPHVRPKPCCVRGGKPIDVVVIFSLPLGNGGGGGSSGGSSGGARKNPLTSVATIAVLLAATAVTAGAAAPLLGASFAASTVGAAIAGTAIGIGGALAIAALSPPPSLRANQGTVSSDRGTDAAASLSGNVLSKGGSIPRVIGTMRVFPAIISPPLIEIVGDTTVAECVYGLAGPHQLSAVEIGTTAETNIPELQTEIQEGLPNSPILGLVQRQSYTDATATVELSQHVIDLSTGGDGVNLLNQTDPALSCPQWDGVTSRVAPDEIWIAFNFPSGLSSTSGAATFTPFRIRMRQFGQSSWINLPEFHVVRTTTASFQVAAKLMWQAAPPTQNVMPNSGGPVRAFTSVPTQNVAPIGSGGWTADSYFYAGSGDTYFYYDNIGTTSGVINVDCFTDKIQFYLNNPTKFPQSGNWEIQAIRGQTIYDAKFNTSDYFSAGAGDPIYDFFGYVTSAGTYQTVYDQRAFADPVELARLSSIWNTPPVPNPAAFAVIAAKVTNRSIDQLSVLASSYVKDWDGAGWNTVTTTSNPAPHIYDVLTGTQGGSPLPPSIVDSAGLVAFRSHCSALGYSCNAVVEGKTYIDVATMIAASGYAQLTHSELWGVMLDQDRSAMSPVQVFTPRNMSGFSVSKAFARLPTGIRASFQDASNNYLANEVIVFADPNNPDSSRLEQIAYDGLVNATDNIAVPGIGVETRAAYDLLQAQLRLTFYKGKSDFESIVCQRGDLVGIQTDIFDNYAGYARIQSVQSSGGNITGLTLDGSLRVNTQAGIFSQAHLFTAPSIFDLGGKTGLCIRLKGGEGIFTQQVTAATNGDETTLTFATPFADPGVDSAGNEQIDVGCLCTSGRLGTEYRRLIVYAVTPQTDGTADMTFVDEAPELWT